MSESGIISYLKFFCLRYVITYIREVAFQFLCRYKNMFDSQTLQGMLVASTPYWTQVETRDNLTGDTLNRGHFASTDWFDFPYLLTDLAVSAYTRCFDCWFIFGLGVTFHRPKVGRSHPLTLFLFPFCKTIFHEFINKLCRHFIKLNILNMDPIEDYMIKNPIVIDNVRFHLQSRVLDWLKLDFQERKSPTLSCLLCKLPD